jgi:hypothetical protein
LIPSGEQSAHPSKSSLVRQLLYKVRREDRGNAVNFFSPVCDLNWRRAVGMFRLDYLSCLLTIVATILVGQKKWTGLVVSGVNSLIVCAIGVHTSQYGFIPANVFCICIYALNLKSWQNKGKESEPAQISTLA